MAAKKKTTTTKTTKKKAASPSPSSKKATKKKAASKSPSTKKAPKKKKAASTPSDPSGTSSESKDAGASRKAGVSALDVNMSHVFSLRPRVATSFKAGDLSTAKHRLKEETYKDIQQAARAVAEKALALTHEASRRGGSKRRF